MEGHVWQACDPDGGSNGHYMFNGQMIPSFGYDQMVMNQRGALKRVNHITPDPF